jgi:hypothetical protein
VGIRPMLATAYAANALSVSVPLAGPALATAFTFRRFTRQGADAPLAGWSLLAGGVISSAAAVLIVLGGGLAAGNILVTAITVLAVAVLVAAVVAMRRDRAGYRPGPSRRAALPPRQLLAGRTGRVADRDLTAASASPPRSRSFAAYRPRTGRRHGR